jgi:hypothetical protein
MLGTQASPAVASAPIPKGVKYLDHWVTEYLDEGTKSWALFEAQLDDRQREVFNSEFDTADVPRDKFAVVGDANRAFDL